MTITPTHPLPSLNEVFGLGAERCVTVRQYIKGIKKAAANRDAEFTTGLRGEWWPVKGSEIMREFMHYVNDAINARGGLKLGRTPAESELFELKRRKIVSKCKWCGRSLGEYRQEWARFCDGSCRKSYCN